MQIICEKKKKAKENLVVMRKKSKIKQRIKYLLFWGKFYFNI